MDGWNGKVVSRWIAIFTALCEQDSILQIYLLGADTTYKSNSTGVLPDTRHKICKNHLPSDNLTLKSGKGNNPKGRWYGQELTLPVMCGALLNSRHIATREQPSSLHGVLCEHTHAKSLGPNGFWKAWCFQYPKRLLVAYALSCVVPNRVVNSTSQTLTSAAKQMPGHATSDVWGGWTAPINSGKIRKKDFPTE